MLDGNKICRTSSFVILKNTRRYLTKYNSPGKGNLQMFVHKQTIFMATLIVSSYINCSKNMFEELCTFQTIFLKSLDNSVWLCFLREWRYGFDVDRDICKWAMFDGRQWGGFSVNIKSEEKPLKIISKRDYHQELLSSSPDIVGSVITVGILL